MTIVEMELFAPAALVLMTLPLATVAFNRAAIGEDIRKVLA